MSGRKINANDALRDRLIYVLTFRSHGTVNDRPKDVCHAVPHDSDGRPFSGRKDVRPVLEDVRHVLGHGNDLPYGRLFAGSTG